MSFDSLLEILRTPWGLFLAIFFFGASIFVHELGHYLAAKWRGLKIECFSIGFGPAIWSRKDRDGVEWKISWIPLGGYVRLPQLGEMQGIEGDNENPTESLPPLSYASKMIVSVMGAVFNVIFAFVLATVLWVTGEMVSDARHSTTVGYVEKTVVDADTGNEVPSPAAAIGIQPGDKIISIDGREISGFDDIIMSVALGHGRSTDGRPEATIIYERNGVKQTAVMNPIRITEDKLRTLGFYPQERLIIHGLFENSPAWNAGLKFSDEIIAVDGQPVFSVMALNEHIRAHPSKPVELTILREGNQQKITATPQLVERIKGQPPQPMIGISFSKNNTLAYIPPWTRLWNSLEMTVRTLKSLISHSSDVGVDSLSGFLQIGNILYRAAMVDIRWLLAITALININLAVLNLLPIPVLDGGHMLFATLTKLFNRPIPSRVVNIMQSSFMVLLLCLMVYVGINDVRRLSRDASMERAFEKEQAKHVEPVFTAPSTTTPATPSGAGK